MGKLEATYKVPSSFSCPTGVAVGRWLWKTGNSCNDYNNVGRKTETLVRSEVAAVGSNLDACASNPETFISCFDFRLARPSPSSLVEGSIQSAEVGKLAETGVLHSAAARQLAASPALRAGVRKLAGTGMLHSAAARQLAATP